MGDVDPVLTDLAVRNRPVHRMAIVARAAMVAVMASGCERTPATVEWRGHVLEEVRSLADVPAVIRSGLGAGRPGRDGIADRCESFNATDVVDATRPMRRFLVAGRDRETWLVALEHGGIGYRVEVFLYSPPAVMPKQEWVLLQFPRTLGDVVKGVSQAETP